MASHLNDEILALSEYSEVCLAAQAASCVAVRVITEETFSTSFEANMYFLRTSRRCDIS